MPVIDMKPEGAFYSVVSEEAKTPAAGLRQHFTLRCGFKEIAPEQLPPRFTLSDIPKDTFVIIEDKPLSATAVTRGGRYMAALFTSPSGNQSLSPGYE